MLQYNILRELFLSWFQYDQKILQIQIIFLELTVLNLRYWLSLCDQDKIKIIIYIFMTQYERNKYY